MAKILSQIIQGSLASLRTAATMEKLPDARWNAKWLKLETTHHKKLKELEREVGRFCFGCWLTPGNGRLLVLFGNNGSGKTHCAEAVRDWAKAVGHGKKFVKQENHISHLDCLYWHWPAALDALKNQQWELVDGMMEATLLIIDELGGGHDPSRVGVDKLCQVLSRRETMWTLVTTNILSGAWVEHFDRRVASRLLRNATLVDLSTVPDYSTL